MSRRMSVTAAALISLVPHAALAHTGVGDMHGFMHGFMHPMDGIDHILAMVTAGMFAASLGGRALWLVPLTFVGMMGLAGAMGATGMALPFVETGIALSIITLGLIVSLNFKPPVVVAMALMAFFALFHGHAHGAELPEDVLGVLYGIGFMTATALLHTIGIVIGLGLGAAAKFGSERVLQLSGLAISLAGGALLIGIL